MSNPGEPFDKEGYDAYLKMRQDMAATPLAPNEAAGEDPTLRDQARQQADAPPGVVLPAPGQPEAGKKAAPSDSGLKVSAEGGVMGAIKDFGRGAAALAVGAYRASGKAVGGTLDFGVDAIAGIHDVTVAPLGEWLNKGPERFPGQKAIAASMLAGQGYTRKTSMADVLSAKEYLGTIGNASINEGVANIGGLIIGTIATGGSKLFQYLPKVTRSGVAFGVSSGVVMDPDTQRLSSALGAMGVHSEFTDWLGADPKDASHMENRFKNALEGVLTGVPLDIAFNGAKYLYSSLKGAPDAAALAASEAALKRLAPGLEAGTPEVASIRGAGVQDIRVNGESVVVLPREPLENLTANAQAAMTGALKDGAERYGPAFPGIDNEAIAPMLRTVAKALHDTPHVVRSDAERNVMAMRVAQEIGISPAEMRAYVHGLGDDLTNADVGMTVAQIFWRKLAGDLDAVAKVGLNEVPDVATVAAHKTAIGNIVNYAGDIQRVRSSLGRGLRSTATLQRITDYAHSKLGIDDVWGKLFKKTNPIPPQPNTVREINDFYEMWNSLKGDPAARQNFLRGINTLPSQWLYLRTSFANNFTANALAGLPSLSMNVVGPTVAGALHTLETTTGGFIGSLNPLLTKSQRSAALSVATNASRAYVQTVMQVPDAFRFAVQAAKENRGILSGTNTMDVGRMGPITPAMRRAAGVEDGIVLGYQLGNLINVWPRSFQRINQGLDEFAKRLAYMGEVRLQAAVDYEMKTGGMAAEVAKGRNALITSKSDYIKYAMENAVDEVGEATSEEALRAAERTTLTGSLSGNEYHPIVGKAAGLVQAMRSQFPETRYIIPVFNVPANALGETIRRIPGVNLFLGETRAELMGELGPVRQADAYGRTMLGAAFLMWAFHASRQGQLTGSGPTDASNRKAWSDQGYQPYSLRVGDKWVNYSRYDLPGGLLGIAANLYDSTVYHRQDDPGYEARMMASIGALAQYFKDKSALQGASNLMNFGASPGADEAFVERTLQSMAVKTLVPNFVTQLGRGSTDDIRRSVTSIPEALMNSLPILSKELDPLRNVLGEPLHTPRDSLAENILPLTIAPATTFKSDPVMSELDRLRQATGIAPGVSHHTEFDGGYYDSTLIELEDGRSLYDHLIGARQTVADPNGVTLRGALQRMFASPEYKAAKDADASNLMDSSGAVSRGAVVSKVFTLYNKAAIQKVAKESPTARKMLAITAAKKIDDARLRPYSAEELASTPELLSALGINLKQYEDRVSGQ